MVRWDDIVEELKHVPHSEEELRRAEKNRVRDFFFPLRSFTERLWISQCNIPEGGASNSFTQGVESQFHQLLHRLTDATGRQTQTPRRQLLGVLHRRLLWQGLLLHFWAWTWQLWQTHFVVRCDLSKGDIMKKNEINISNSNVPSLPC